MLRLITKTSKYYYHFILATLFISVGFVISAVSIFVTGYYQLNAAHKEFSAMAKNTLVFKKEFIHAQTNNFKNNFIAVEKTPEFKDFIQSDPNKSTIDKEHITSIMMAIAYSDSNIMQFRFLDKSGYEAIRIERASIGTLPYKVEKNFLQDKAQRYYFKKAKEIGENDIWFSQVDLNIEHEKLEQPIVPTLRIAKPYYINGEFKGILIINIFMKKILDEVMKSELFNVAIIDKESHILTNNLQGYDKQKREWTRYLENAREVRYVQDKDKNSFLLNLLFQKQHFNAELSDVIENNEGLKIVLETRVEKLLEYTGDIVDYMLIMSFMVFAISFPIAMVLARYPLKLHGELKKIKDDLEKQLEIIDKFVYISRTDLKGNITDVSTAFTKLSGYSKNELIGANHSILKSPDVSASFYKEMWDVILNGKNWTSVIKNIDKDGNVYWIRNHVSPVVDKGKITGFTAVGENITDQKVIEALSIKDELTQAYNRRFFNQIFSKELKRAIRNGSIFSIAMFDIDYFKKYNDTYGHIRGDEALQKVVAQVSKKLQRPDDYLFRIGGEEFMVIFSEMQSFQEAKKFSLELVKAVENLKIEHKTSEVSDTLTISLGLLNVTPKCNMHEDAILKRVDELLYSAKEGGRNQLVSEEC